MNFTYNATIAFMLPIFLSATLKIMYVMSLA